MMIGRSGSSSWIRSRTSRPDIPGMTMSRMRVSTGWRRANSRASWPEPAAYTWNHDDRHVDRGGIPPQFLADLDPRQPRHGEVEEDQVRRVGQGRGKGRFSITGQLHLKPFLPEESLQELSTVRLVIHHQNALCHHCLR